MIALTRQIAVDHGRRDIRANAMGPGVLRTRLVEGTVAGRAATVAPTTSSTGADRAVTGKVVPLGEALETIPDGSALGTGGVLLARKPVALLDALARAGRRDLTVYTLLGSVDVELLAAHGALAAVGAIYVGFEQHGFAPAYSAAVARGEIAAGDRSELIFMAGLRAAATGLPFLPTRGGTGSDVPAELGLETVRCPYTSEELIAAPAIRPDVALLHAEAADTHGNVPLAAEPDFLVEFDASLARASARVIVSVERLAEPGDTDGPMLLFGHEVDAVVIAPGGARPTAVPGRYDADVAALEAYVREARAGDARAALDRHLIP